MLNDNSLIPFGRYKFTAICRVPVDYLLKQGENKGKDPFYVELREYINENSEKLIARKLGVIETPKFEYPCKKISYASEKIAKEVLNNIKVIEQSHKKPCRAYECEICSGWHLTSKTLEDYKQYAK